MSLLYENKLYFHQTVSVLLSCSYAKQAGFAKMKIIVAKIERVNANKPVMSEEGYLNTERLSIV